MEILSFKLLCAAIERTLNAPRGTPSAARTKSSKALRCKRRLDQLFGISKNGLLDLRRAVVFEQQLLKKFNGSVRVIIKDHVVVKGLRPQKRLHRSRFPYSRSETRS